MANFTLKQLRYFEALAAQGHFGRAAEVSSVTQPALSVQIKELEQNLGQPLFERNPRHVRLTPFGQDVARRVRLILQASDELGDFSRTAGKGLSGPFRLGIIPTIAPYLLPQLVARLDQSHPELDLHLRETVTPRLIEALQQGDLDCAILALPVHEPAFTEVPLFDEEFLLVRPRADANAAPLTAADLQGMRVLMLEEGHCFREQALAFCNMPGARAGLDGTSLSTLVQMVGSGIGVTMIPQMAVAVETRSAPVVCTPFAGPKPGRTVGMVWRKSTPLAAELAKIAAEVRACGPSQ